jgi:SWIRM domain
MDSSWTKSPGPAKQSSIYNLLSPPKDKRQDSFDSASDKMSGITPNTSFTADNASQTLLPAPHATPKAQLGGLPSPVSPEFRDVKEKASRDEVDGAQDPQLFTGSEMGDIPLPVDVPLFPRQNQSDQMQIERDVAISQHMSRSTSQRSVVSAASTSTSATSTSRPSKDEYDLVLSIAQWAKHPMTMSVMPYLRADPVGAYQRGRAELKEIGKRKPEPRRLPPKSSSRSTLNPPTFKVKKPTASLKPRPARAPRQPFERTFVMQHYGELRQAPSPTMKAPRPASTREDVDYKSIIDYSPPMSTLDHLEPGKKPLKIDWKGSPLPLDNDPDRYLLHDQEVAAASSLRLNCAQYLTSKRRIFQAKLEKLRQGKEFRKTDAQQACKIDVNKASKLWTAFDRAGWFRREHFVQYL